MRQCPGAFSDEAIRPLIVIVADQASHRPRSRWPAGAMDQDHRSPPPSFSRSCDARLQATLPGTNPPPGATRSCVKSYLIRAFASRSDDAQRSSVVSIDTPDIHDPPNHGRPSIQRSQIFATVMLGWADPVDGEPRARRPGGRGDAHDVNAMTRGAEREHSAPVAIGCHRQRALE